MKPLKVSVGKLNGVPPGGTAAVPVPLPNNVRKNVPYGLVRPDPNQPRKTFSQASLEELAESIRQQGIVQDLVMERMPARYRLLDPDLTNDKWRVEERQPDGAWLLACEDTETECRAFLQDCPPNRGKDDPDPLAEHYQIVCGERRWRAAGLAGLTELPAKVFESLTAEQRFAMQFVENCQRENVSALEEAAAMAKTIEERRRTDASFSPEKLAAELGMSRAGAYERLKLNRLQPKIREALVAGTISTSIAQEVAKLPTQYLQGKLLKTLEERAKYRPMSVREVKEEIEHSYCRDLKDAPFDLTNRNYFTGLDCKEIARMPEGVCVGSCEECRHRTGNMVTEFPDLKATPNECTNPECYGEKSKAHWLKEAKDQAQQGTTVLTAQEFKKQNKELARADEYVYPIGKNGALETLLGKHAPEPVLVATDEGLSKYYRKVDLPEAFKAAKIKFREQDKSITAATPEEKAKAEAAAEAARAMGERRVDFAKAALPRLAKALEKLSQAKSWEVARMLSGTMGGWLDNDVAKTLAGKGTEARVVVLARLFADEENHPLDGDNDWIPENAEAWKAAGLDLMAEFKEAEKAHEAKPELPLAKAEPKQKELPGVTAVKMKGLSPAARAHIAAAKKARWAKIKAAKS